MRAPEDHTRAAPKKQVSVKPSSKYRPKYHSADKIAVVLSYKNKCIFYQLMSKIGENQRFLDYEDPGKGIYNIYQTFYLNQERGKLDRIILTGVWGPMHRVSFVT